MRWAARHASAAFGTTLSGARLQWARMYARPWVPPVVLWAAVAAFNVVTALIKGVHTAHAAALQWWLAPDAEIPQLTAQWFLHGGPFLPGSGWSPLDRGPLQPAILIATGATLVGPTAAYFVGVVVNSAWVIGLWALLRVVGIDRSRSAVVVVAAALCGPVWINSVYPWPKLLAAGLCLGFAAAILDGRPLLGGSLAALAMLTHGSALFAFVGLVPVAIWRLGWRRAGGFALVALSPAFAWSIVAAIIPAPGWGPRLIQWHFGGTDVLEPDRRNPLASVLGSYRDAGASVVANKVANLRVILGDWTVWSKNAADDWYQNVSSLGFVRSLQLNHLLWAPGILLVGLLRPRRAPGVLWLLVAVWALALMVLEWGGFDAAAPWLVVAPLSLLLVLVAVCALGIGRWVVVLQAAYFVPMWWLAPPLLAGG
jgi:hypothetical protein